MLVVPPPNKIRSPVYPAALLCANLLNCKNPLLVEKDNNFPTQDYNNDCLDSTSLSRRSCRTDPINLQFF